MDSDSDSVYQEILEWVDQRARPNSSRRYSRCPICDLTWWDDKERHNSGCWVPRLRNLAEDLVSADG